MKSRKERHEERQRTLRKSRRLALKRRREQQLLRRTSVGDALDISPQKSKHSGLAEAAAEQMAAKAAAMVDQQTRQHKKQSAGKKERKHKERKGRGQERRSKSGKKGSERMSFWGKDHDVTVRSSLLEMFNVDTDISEGEEGDTESESREEPNTQDRTFILTDDEWDEKIGHCPG